LVDCCRTGTLLNCLSVVQRVRFHAGSVIVYDNQLGLSDDGDPTTILGGGSIVLHK